jgi:uncharacterized repeat protein (TIGR01451 family)
MKTKMTFGAHARHILTAAGAIVALGAPAFAGGGGPSGGFNSWLNVAFLVDNGQQEVANCQDELVFSLFAAVGTNPGQEQRSNVRLTIPKPGPTSPGGNGLWVVGGASTANAHGTCVIEPYDSATPQITAVCDVVGDSDPNTWNDDYAVLHATFVAIATDDPMVVTGLASVPVSDSVNLVFNADPHDVETVPCSGGAAGIDIATSKTDGGATVAPGGTVAYTITVVNQGTAVTSNVVQLNDTVPANSTFNAAASSAGWGCADGAPAGTLCTQNLGFMSPGQSRVRTFAVNANNPIPGGVTQLTNTAIALASGDVNGGNNSAMDTTPIVIAAPDLAITKTDGGVSTVPGGVVAYSLGVTNTSSTTATGVVVSETVPANTSFNAGSSSAGWSCANGAPAGSSCTRNLGAIAGGGNALSTFAVTVATPLPGGTTAISNTATVADDGASGPDPTPANNTASDSTPINPAGLTVDLAITKTDGGVETIPGGVVIYSLGYTNAGNTGATGVVLSETVPSSASFFAASSSPGWSCPDGSGPGTACTLAIGAVAGGGAGGNRAFAVQVNDPLDGNVTAITNTATIAGNEPDANPLNNSATDSTPIEAGSVSIDLEVAKTADVATVGAGDLITYDLEVCNSGNGNATGVVLSETVPQHTTFEVAGSSPGWSCANGAPAGTLCTLALGTIPAGSCGGGGGGVLVEGSSVLRTFRVRVVSPIPSGVTQIHNAVAVFGDQPDDDPDDDTDEDDRPVVEPLDLQIVKSDGGASTAPGGGVSYVLDISNQSLRSATGVTVSETVPANTSFNAGASSPGWSCANGAPAGSSCTLAIGALAGAGGSTSRVFAVAVDSPLPGGTTSIDNTATVTDDGVNGPDANAADNTASDSTPVDAGATNVDLVIDKDDGGISTTPGAIVPYVLTYSNIGNIGATGVILTETVPSNATFNFAGSSPGWSCANGAPTGSVCSMAIGSLAGGGGGGQRTFAVTVSNLPAGVTEISNTASIADDGASGPDPSPANNTASDTTPLDPAGTGFDLAITKNDGGISVSAGEVIAYALSVANNGNQEATGVVISETVPADTAFDAGASSAGWSCASGAPAGSSCTFAVGALGVGAMSNLTFAVTVDDPPGTALVTNTATVAGNGTDLNPADNTATDTTPVSGATLDAAISKEANAAGVYGGDIIIYTLGWDLTGSGSSRVEILETVPENATFVAAASTAGWSCADGSPAGTTCSWQSAAAATAGASGTLVFAVEVDPGIEGVSSIENTGVVDLMDALDADPGNNSASATVEVLYGGPGTPPNPIEIPVNAPIALAMMAAAIAAWGAFGLRKQ